MFQHLFEEAVDAKLIHYTCSLSIDWFTPSVRPLTVDFYHPLDIYQWSQPRIIVETARWGDEEKE